MSEENIPNDAREAKHGEKMIEVKLRFWTDNIAPAGMIKPKHAWTSGMARIERNASHEIVPSKGMPFNSLLDIHQAIADVLIEHGIVLHPSPRDRKYLEP